MSGVVLVSFFFGGIVIIYRGFVIGINVRNGMEIIFGCFLVDFVNIEWIEVLKGFLGILFGFLVFFYGGVINLVIKKFFEKIVIEIFYIVGSFNLNRIIVDVNIFLNKEKIVLFRVNLVYNNEKSFLDYGFNKIIFVFLSFIYKVSDKFIFNIDVEFINLNNIRCIYNIYGVIFGIINSGDL